MGTYTNWGDLENALKKELASAMEELKDKVYDDLHKEVSSFYSQGKPKLYVRTFQLYDSPMVTPVAMGGLRGSFDAYLQPPTYVVPNPVFINAGFASHFTGQEVLQASQNNAAHILGKGGYWARFLADAKNDVISVMSKHFT